MSLQYPGQHLAILRSRTPDKQYGIRARLSLNNPQPVGLDQTSMAEMWVQSNGGDQMNGLQTGWIVAPQANGDDRTHLFVLTTTDGYKTRCFNTLCGTFIQTDSTLPVDAELEPISVIGGKQHEVDLAIVLDNDTRHWWLVLDGTIYLGYFPTQIFTQLGDGGTYIAWGGLTIAPLGEWSPPMGTGHNEFGTEDTRLLGYFSHLRLVDSLYNYIDPNEHVLEEYRDSYLCYDIKYLGHRSNMGHMFFYGGPGSDKCGI
ncbi:putative NEP-interacting protein [Thalictrum thalictroides]|uniref:Putative NEP-interacting protein n=1 Tax=Thalictrum thalictroides TaxID=46969 RepID=A0A7J6UVH2_THATH|nr:putative NEP-interacting protein [Thalictrum thalictroides]